MQICVSWEAQIVCIAPSTAKPTICERRYSHPIHHMGCTMLRKFWLLCAECLTWTLLITVSFLGQNIDTNNLKEEGFILAHSINTRSASSRNGTAGEHGCSQHGSQETE